MECRCFYTLIFSFQSVGTAYIPEEWRRDTAHKRGQSSFHNTRSGGYAAGYRENYRRNSLTLHLKLEYVQAQIYS